MTALSALIPSTTALLALHADHRVLPAKPEETLLRFLDHLDRKLIPVLDPQLLHGGFNCEVYRLGSDLDLDVTHVTSSCADGACSRRSLGVF
jgi:hypothetical protein